MRITSVALIAVTALLVAACTGAPAATQRPPTPGATTSTGTPAPATPAATEDLAALGPIRVGVEAPGGEAYIPTQLTVKRLQDLGYDVEIVMFEDPDVMPQALDSGEININANSVGQIFSAVDAGLDVKATMGLTDPDFVMVADSDFPTCESLDGARLAQQGTTGFGFASVSLWLERECPGTTPQMLDIPGSENRAVALLEGQIDATSLHLLRALQLQEAKPGEFVIIDGFGSPEGVTSAWQYSLTEWLDANPELADAYLQTYQDVVADMEADPQLGIDEGLATIPDAPAHLIEQVMQEWAEQGWWTAADGVSEEVFDATLAFYEDFTDYENELTYEQVVRPPTE